MNIKTTIYFTLIYLFFGISLMAQSFKQLNKRADANFNQGEFSAALNDYLVLDSLSPGNGTLNYRIGICYLKSVEKAKSLPYLLHAKELTYNSEGMDFNLGLSFLNNEKFEEAITAFEGLKKKLSGKIDNMKLKEINGYIKNSKNGIELKSKPLQVTIKNLGMNINSSAPEYAPVISGTEDKLIFTSKRNSGNKEQNLNEDIYISEKDSANNWSIALPISNNINSSGHDASVSLSADGQNLLIYKDSGNGDIYSSQLLGNIWTQPKSLLFPINTKYWEPSACLSPDGKYILIISNRPGGIGGMDLYFSKKQPNGKWSVLKNMGPKVNTETDEDSPYFHPDGKTVYFSSKGHTSMGGFDIFSFNFLNDSIGPTLPVNVGYPINTVNDDLFVVWSADGTRGYFSSDRPEGYGDKDIYIITRPNAEVSLIMLKGFVKQKITESPLEAKIIITDNIKNEIVGEYFSNSSTGKYSLFLSPGKNYGISIEAKRHLPYSENIDLLEPKFYEVKRDFFLEIPEYGNSIILKNVFFETGKWIIKKESFNELNKIANYLIQNKKLKVKIAGYTDDVGNAADNLNLSKNRAMEVVIYLKNKKIEDNRLTFVGLGSENPIATNETEAGRKLNRRTELIIINK